MLYFEINSKDMVKVAKLCKKVIDKKAVLPILSSLKVDVMPVKVSFSCTNLDQALIISTECQTQGEGSFLLPFKTIENLNPEGKVIVKYENSIEIKKDTGSVILKADNVEDFPVIPRDEVKYDLSEDFINKLEGCLPAVSEDETRYVLNGICIQKDSIVATDGRRLHLYKADNPEIFSLFDKSGIILPSKTAKLLHAIAKSEKNVKIRTGMEGKIVAKERGRIHPMQPELNRPKIEKPAQVTFQVGNILLVSKLIDGKFPNWRQVITDEAKITVEIDKDLLLSTLEDSLNSADSKNPVVMMHFDTETDKLEIYTDNSLRNNSEFCSSLSFVNGNSAAPFGMAVNPEFVNDALDVIDEERVKLMFAEPLKPVILQSQENDKALFVIMPVRVNEPVVSYAEFCEQKKQKEEKKTEEQCNSEESINQEDEAAEPVAVGD